MFGRICLRSHLVLDSCLLKVVKFQLQDVWLIGLFIFSLSSYLVPSSFLLGVCQFLLGCQFYQCLVACDDNLLRVFLCTVPSLFSFLISFLLFFWMNVPKGLSVFFIFSKKWLFGFIDLCWFFVHFYFFSLALWFFQTLRFCCCSLSNCSRYKIGLFEGVFVGFLRYVCIAVNFLLELLLLHPGGFLGCDVFIFTHL